MDAVDKGATLVVLPEKWHMPGQPELQQVAAEQLDGPLVRTVCKWARTFGIWLVAGSIVEERPGHSRSANTSVMIGPDGLVRDAYRKIHMFDVTVDGVEYRESANEEPGDHLVVCDMEGVGVGLSICYDLRFPEVYRALALAGAKILTVPSCFTRRTGQDHWEVLLRARAIENSCYVLAPNVIGGHGDGKESYGRSMIVDPWGTVLATAPDKDSMIVADLDLAYLDTVRQSIPALAGRIPEAYTVE